MCHQDMLPTLLAAAGEPDINKKLLTGHKAGSKTFRVHIDGVNLLPYLTGQVKESPRTAFFYVSDDGGVMAVRSGDYKLVFAEQRAESTQVWAEPMVPLRLPLIFNLRRDPFERAQHNSNVYWDWVMNHIPQLYECQAIVAAQIDNFVKYPPRQKAASFNLDAVMRQLGPAIEAEKSREAAEEKRPARPRHRAAPAHARPHQSPGPPAANRARTRAGDELRSDRVHRRPSPSRRS